MFKKYLSQIILIFILIKCVFNQPPPSPFPRHPNDELLFDMEKKGMRPHNVNFRIEDKHVPNIIVDVEEIKDADDRNDVITNKSKLRITWKIDNGPNDMDNNSLPSFTVKLLSNVTQDSTNTLFYSYNEKIIQSNVNNYTIEYDVPKLNEFCENCVYNFAVIEDSKSDIKNVGISKTFTYKLREKENKINKKEVDGNKGVNPLVFLGIGVVGISIIALAFLISKRFSKNDSSDDDDKYNLPVQSPSSEYRLRNGTDDKNADHVSVVSDDTGEVSWSNLEIAQDSKQTKNESNDGVYTTLDKRFKRGTKDRYNNIYGLNENQLYKVVRMFTPTEEDEVKLNIGDEVKITEIFEDGWCEGTNNSTNQSGVFPRTCVVEAEHYASMIEKSKNSLLPNRRRSRQSYIANNRNSYNNQAEAELIGIQTNSLKE